MLRGRTGLSPVMIGRHGALSRLLGLIDAAEIATGDSPEIALVSGEAGVGKTRLLREFIAALPGDVTVLAAQAQPGSMGRAFDVVGQLLGHSATGTSIDDIADEARRVVAAAVAKGRTLLVVEDLHWADADSVHFVEQLCMQPWPNLVVVGTYRGTDLSRKAPGGELVLRLERQHNVDQLRLERLDRSEVAALLGAITEGAPSSGAVEAVFRRSGGIPFVVEELIRCCGPLACTDDLRTAQLPWSLDEAVRQQLGGLDADERRVVDALSVFGDPAPFEVLAEVCSLEDDRILAALRSLVAVGIVIEPSDDRFWFAHALVADAVHQQLIGRERRRLHERSFAALRAMPEPDHAALARHALGAGQFDLIPSIAREGARRYLDRGASFQALRLASQGLAEAPGDPELLAVATDAAWRLEYGDEALTYAQQWFDNAVTDLDRVESLRFVARMHHELFDWVRRDVVLAELEAFADGLGAGMARGRAAGAVAQVHMLAGRGAEAVQWADRALAEARRTGDEWLEAQASVERASAQESFGDRTDAERQLLEARELAHRVGDGVLECRALNNLMGVTMPHSERGEWARNELRAAASRSGLDRFGVGMVVTWEAEAAFARGDQAVVRRSLAEAGQYFSNGSCEHWHFMGQFAALRLEEGLVEKAMELVDEVHHGQPLREEDHVGELRLRLAGHALRGRRAEAEVVFDALLRLEPVRDSSWSLSFFIDTAMYALMAGIPARRVREELLGRWAADLPSRDLVAAHVEGLLLMAEGDNAAAIAAFQAVLVAPDAVLYVPIRGSLRTALAAALLATGDRVLSLVVAQQAAADLITWPGWRRDRVEALIRRLEGGQRSDGELTTREREVAALISEGLTNSQLAERLFISPKTAAVHVSNILTKLGLSSRAEIAAWAVRHGIVLQTS
jgi:DNA-binding NarL/FixJ family response regulator